MPDGAVIIAAITSCTNTSNPRNVIAAGLIARNANARGLMRKPWVKSSLAPGSKAVQLYLEEAGLLPELEKLGFGIVGFACTTCNGMSGALDPAIQQEVIERDLYATAVLSGNRNFDGRIHPYAKQAFLASPPLVVAYAIAGTVRFDIEKDVLGIDATGNAGHAQGHLAQRRGDRRDRRQSASSRTSSARCTSRCSRSASSTARRSARCTTGARRAPTSVARRTGKARWPASARSAACARWRCSATTSPPTTCRRRTRSWLDSAAGEYLAKMGLPEEDFNSYATHRGDHLTAQRATFANPEADQRDGARRGRQREAGFAGADRAGGQVTRMWEAIETYMERRQPLIIIAGADYGQGSSRDWAAKGVRLAGVEAIAAEGFERIHRTNLIGMGVLPLEFQPGTNRTTLRHRRHRNLRRDRRTHAARDADPGDPPPQRRARRSAGDLPPGHRRGSIDLRGRRRAAALRQRLPGVRAGGVGTVGDASASHTRGQSRLPDAAVGQSVIVTSKQKGRSGPPEP